MHRQVWESNARDSVSHLFSTVTRTSLHDRLPTSNVNNERLHWFGVVLLLLVVFCNRYVVPPVMHGTVPRIRALAFLGLSWISNFAGAMFVAYVIAYLGEWYVTIRVLRNIVVRVHQYAPFHPARPCRPPNCF